MFLVAAAALVAAGAAALHARRAAARAPPGAPLWRESASLQRAREAGGAGPQSAAVWSSPASLAASWSFTCGRTDPWWAHRQRPLAFDPATCCGAPDASARHAVAFAYDRRPLPGHVARRVQEVAGRVRELMHGAIPRLDVLLLLPELDGKDEDSESAAAVLAEERRALPPEDERSFAVRELSMPVREGALCEAQREALRREGANCCGWREYFKLAAWSLEEYTRVVLLDADVWPNAAFDELLSCGELFLYAGGPASPLNGGVLALKPSHADLAAMVDALTGPEAFNFSDAGGWDGHHFAAWNEHERDWTHGVRALGQEGPQGFLHHFWAVRRPERARRLSGCAYDHIMRWMCPRQDNLAELRFVAKLVHKPFCARRNAESGEWAAVDDPRNRVCTSSPGGAEAAEPPWLRLAGLAFTQRLDLLPQEQLEAIQRLNRTYGGNLTAAMVALQGGQHTA